MYYIKHIIYIYIIYLIYVPPSGIWWGQCFVTRSNATFQAPILTSQGASHYKHYTLHTLSDCSYSALMLPCSPNDARATAWCCC